MALPCSRGQVKRKWRVDSQSGPLVLFAELLQKKLIQHSFPCEYKIHRDYAVFYPLKGRILGPDFTQALETSLRIVARQYNASASQYRHAVKLHGHYTVIKTGPNSRKLKCLSTSAKAQSASS